jgi:hypothetical protein
MERRSRGAQCGEGLAFGAAAPDCATARQEARGLSIRATVAALCRQILSLNATMRSLDRHQARFSYPRSWEDVAMRNEVLEEIGDTLFAVAIAGAIGLGAANLAIQVDKERAIFDAAAATQKLGLLAHPPSSPDTADTGADKTIPAS